MIRSTTSKYIRRMGDEHRASDWVPRQIAPKNMMIDGRNAESSLVDINQFKWEKKTKRFLLDSCADMHICNDRGAFLTFGPPDLAQVGVGKAGEYVKFEGMGTIVIGMAVEHASGEKSAMGLLIEKAYKPMPGQSSTNIISTGRIFEMQSVEFWPNATNRLVLGEYHHDFSLQNYSPYILAVVPMKNESEQAGERAHYGSATPHDAESCASTFGTCVLELGGQRCSAFPRRGRARATSA